MLKIKKIKLKPLKVVQFEIPKNRYVKVTVQQKAVKIKNINRGL